MLNHPALVSKAHEERIVRKMSLHSRVMDLMLSLGTTGY